MKYVYTAWFRDDILPENDPDLEWPACFVIEGECAESIQGWGDSIAFEYAKKKEQTFLKSVIESVDISTLLGIELLPVLKEGTQPEDEEIGW